jgi:hypothetical protein
MASCRTVPPPDRHGPTTGEHAGLAATWRRPTLGFLFVALGLGSAGAGAALLAAGFAGVWATHPFTGFGATVAGVLCEAVGVPLVRGSRLSGAERGTSLAVVVPMVLVTSVVLLGATLAFGSNFERAATAGQWAGATITWLVSAVVLFALLRHLFLRARERGLRRRYRARSRRWELASRWKEELVCEAAEGRLVLDLTTRVFFPTDRAWAREAPAWARGRRAELLAELEEWCWVHRVPLHVDDTGTVRAS